MEIETAVRANIPLLIIIINNNGIYHGLDTKSYNETPTNNLPSTALLPDVRYDLIANAAGGKGYFIKTPQELSNALDEALKDDNKCIVINVMIQPGGKKKLVCSKINCSFNTKNISFYEVKKKNPFNFRSLLGWQQQSQNCKKKKSNYYTCNILIIKYSILLNYLYYFVQL